MDANRFDSIARTLAAATSRRQIVARLARGAAGGALALAGGVRAGAQPGCREEGHPCEGNQTCCEGLTCAPSGPGAADRCTAAAECEGPCPQTTVALAGEGFRVEADCAFAADAGQTTCTFSAFAATEAGGTSVVSVALPEAQLCAEIVGGDFEEVDLGPNGRGKGKGKRKGFKSKKADEGRATVTLVLVGEVTTGATATYWCETGADLVVPVPGPGLDCEVAEPTPLDDISDSTGAIVVLAYACEAAAEGTDVDWFGKCGEATAGAPFRLSRSDGGQLVEVDTQATDQEGLCRFGQLEPGTYRLEQTDSIWCHAESDSVDERGDVVVKAGARSSVWIFNCEAAK